MRIRGLAGLSLVTSIAIFAACGGDDDGTSNATPDAGADGTIDTTSSSSSSSSSSSGSAGDDDDAGIDGGDGGADTGDADAGPILNLPPSCKATNGVGAGINTCGATEATSDDCCKSLTLPATTTRTLDKYEITAGRMRQFATAQPNIRQFANQYAKANPTSQLGKVLASFPKTADFGSYLDTLPMQTDAQNPLDEAVFLGAFPVDAINVEDGCFVSPGGYGAATYWQPPANLKPYGIGLTKGADNKPDGTRKYSQAEYDEKSLNCVSALMLATFCAWDGGELATTSDYREVWGIQKVTLPGTGGATVFVPWEDVLPWSQFNWRNGHDGACPKGWPGCVAPAEVFFSFPTVPAPKPADDDAPEIGAPGRFPKDVTKAVSSDPGAGGWFDIGGNLMELAWPNGSGKMKPAAPANFCDTSAGDTGVPAAQQCNRDQSASDKRPGTLRYKGTNPGIALIGYSFEVHAQRSEKYLSSATDDESLIAAGDVKPAHFQYGKIGGRCVRTK